MLHPEKKIPPPSTNHSRGGKKGLSCTLYFQIYSSMFVFFTLIIPQEFLVINFARPLKLFLDFLCITATWNDSLSFPLWMLDFSRTVSCKNTLCLSVHPSVHPLLNFLKISSLVFSDILLDDRLPLYLVTDQARFLKNIVVAWIWAQWT